MDYYSFNRPPRGQLTRAAWPDHCASLCLQDARGGCAADGSGQWRKAH